MSKPAKPSSTWENDPRYRMTPSYLGGPPLGSEPAEPVVDVKTFTVQEVADTIGIGLTSAKRIVASGELASFVIGRRRLIRGESLDDYLAKREAGKSGRRK